MSNTTVVKANGANHIVSAAEAGMERWREKFAPERPLDACCHTCGGGLQRDYVRLRQEDLQGRPIWLHIGPCLAQFASWRLRSAESRLRRSGAVDYYRGVSSLR
ncbi:MAG: hypothetical protein CFH39_00582 [Alphaproteobacteria bacterium MarineAlpha10_Bin2]|nr:MAG: hypothetical protein CFH39_00582 [Alphaproteobacteria bacterium MarineAlpha10_Bin2]